jgi:hypothetical protein
MRHSNRGGNMKVNDEQFQSANPVLPVKNVKETTLFYKEK